jgi:hypothetical protein
MDKQQPDCALEPAEVSQPAITRTQQEPVAWFCANAVTGRMLYTDSIDEAAAMREQKHGHWTVTPLYAVPPSPAVDLLLQSTATTQPATTNRVEFERWYSDQYTWPKAIERSGEHYKVMHAQQSWIAWQAALTYVRMRDGRPEKNGGEE